MQHKRLCSYYRVSRAQKSRWGLPWQLQAEPKVPYLGRCAFDISPGTHTHGVGRQGRAKHKRNSTGGIYKVRAWEVMKADEVREYWVRNVDKSKDEKRLSEAVARRGVLLLIKARSDSPWAWVDMTGQVSQMQMKLQMRTREKNGLSRKPNYLVPPFFPVFLSPLKFREPAGLLLDRTCICRRPLVLVCEWSLKRMPT